MNQNFKWKDIKKNIGNVDYMWAISKNPSISWAVIINNPEKKWSWHCISINPNITYQIINSHPEKKWDWRAISFNSFSYQNELIRDQCLDELYAVQLIKSYWVRIFWDPRYKIGIKRLQRSFENLDYNVWEKI